MMTVTKIAMMSLIIIIMNMTSKLITFTNDNDKDGNYNTENRYYPCYFHKQLAVVLILQLATLS